ncbi:MAG: hypothetical protein AB8H86_29475 [Polyangiales bacterium]
MGNGHALLLRSDGLLFGVGQNAFGVVTLPQFPAGTTPTRVFAGPGTSAALLSDGSLVCWGDNTRGQCNVPALPAGLSYVDVSLGLYHTLALRSDGSIVTFGSTLVGLGNIPTRPVGVTWTHVAVDAGFSVAVRSDGVVESWGLNDRGQCNVPALPNVPIVQIDAAFEHTAALLADGRVICWGDERHIKGDLHELPGSYQGQPTATYVDMAVGWSHALALLSDGTAVGFGVDANGMTTFPTLPPNVHYTRVFGSLFRSGALRSDGELVIFGQPGIWNNVPPLPPGVEYVDAALSTIHTVALRSDGEAVAWGSNGFGATAIPPLPAGAHYIAVDGDYGRTSLLRSDDTVIGLGPAWNYTAPTPPAGVHFVDVACCDTYDVVLRSDGTVVTWGSTPFVPAPVLPWGVYYVEIDGGSRQAALRRSDGQVVHLGSNLYESQRLAPGTSYVQLSNYDTTSGARVGPETTFTGIGPGCAGTLPPARLVPRDTPRIGRTFELTVFDLPADLALLGMSIAVPAAPSPLASLGMPGCDWHIGLDGTALLQGQDGSASFELAIPDVPLLVGTRFQHQVLVLDPGVNAGLGIGAVVSDAMEGVIGRP